MSTKRPRTPTRSSSSSSSSVSPSHPATKSARAQLSPGSGGHKASLQCTLPPTCNPPRNHPTLIASTKDLESHYAMYHAHVCEALGCGGVFPDARLLELVSFKIENQYYPSITLYYWCPHAGGGRIITLISCLSLRRTIFKIVHLTRHCSCAAPNGMS